MQPYPCITAVFTVIEIEHIQLCFPTCKFSPYFNWWVCKKKITCKAVSLACSINAIGAVTKGDYDSKENLKK